MDVNLNSHNNPNNPNYSYSMDMNQSNLNRVPAPTLKPNEKSKLIFLINKKYNKLMKESIIKKWVEQDESREKFYEETEAPVDITCLTCGKLTFVISKTLDISIDDKKPDRIIFMYQCPLNHLPHRAFYNDGTEYRSKVYACPKCSGSLTDTHNRTGDVITTTNACSKCDHVEVSTLELNRKEKYCPASTLYLKLISSDSSSCV